MDSDEGKVEPKKERKRKRQKKETIKKLKKQTKNKTEGTEQESVNVLQDIVANKICLEMLPLNRL